MKGSSLVNVNGFTEILQSAAELLIAHTLRAGTQRDQPDSCHYEMELGSGEVAS